MLIKCVSFCLGKLSILIGKILQWSHLCRLNQSYQRSPRNILKYTLLWKLLLKAGLKVRHYSKKKT